MRVGDRVKCTKGSIDKGEHAGRTGRIIRFTQFSNYHPLEVEVSFSNNYGDWGFFWKHDCELAALRKEPHPERPG